MKGRILSALHAPMLEETQKKTFREVASPGERVIVGAFVDRDLKRALTARAAASERSVSAEIRVALRRHLADAGTG